MKAGRGTSAQKPAVWLIGPVVGILALAFGLARLNNRIQGPLPDTPPAPVEPLVNAIEAPLCSNRPIGTQYAIVCVDGRYLETDDREACADFGGPFQIIVCPNPSQIPSGDIRPTLAAGGGAVILPLPPTPSPATNTEPMTTVDVSGSPTAEVGSGQVINATATPLGNNQLPDTPIDIPLTRVTAREIGVPIEPASATPQPAQT
ncbi:MAG: hypothetical protein RMN25_07360, partial [Anaerolineae bacterium]|nr:hypothetical protein [Thermoflexales bacterium]MDW8407587.1 hypothetical protein [Anaerolineae bacterium]